MVIFLSGVLDEGPPGTGKTSMCKALAQQLAIRLSDRFVQIGVCIPVVFVIFFFGSSRYTHGVLVEINSHSLFSKWFSESGKLVQKMFQHIVDLVSDEYTFVCVLIDEVITAFTVFFLF